MKHTAQDFAQAEFAIDDRGHRALRRADFPTGLKWIYYRAGTPFERSDRDMADEACWTPVVATAPVESKEPARIENPLDLKEFASTHGLRHDWHEPDESNINARIIGTHLDNAMGSSTRFERADWGGEFNVVLTRMDDTDREIQEDLAVVNLATLLSWAAQHGECQR